LHEFVFRQQAAIALDQGKEDLKRFWRKRNRVSLAQEEMFTGVAAKSPELVQNLCFRGHDYLWNFFGTYQEIFNVPLRTNLIGAAYFGFGAGGLAAIKRDSSGRDGMPQGSARQPEDHGPLCLEITQGEI
jgi:hypothetical protein